MPGLVTPGCRVVDGYRGCEITAFQLADLDRPPYPWQMASPDQSKQDHVKKVEVQAITDAAVSLSEDQAGRMKKYFASMMIRTACFILAVVLPSPYRWMALVGAVTLPYIAVVVANAGRETIMGRARRLNDVKGLPAAK